MSKEIIKLDSIENRIFSIREKKVMIDRDLAELYGVETRILNQAVKRNAERFPADFMFQLTPAEFSILKSHFVISSWGGVRKMPFAFTDYGVAMLSGVLNSETAIQINIKIMRAFTRMRQLTMQSADLRKAISTIEKRLDGHDRQIQIAFDALKSIISPKDMPVQSEYSPDGKKRMGFADHEN
jgi:hypothetical protein